MVNATDAIAAINRPAPRPATAQRQLYLVGNVGDLGEKVLNRFLAASEYSHVTVAARSPLRSAHAKLIVHALDATLLDTETLPANTDDLVCCISGRANFYRRDEAYLPVTAEMVLPLAQLAVRSGVKRFMLVSPMSAWLQMSAVQEAAFGEVELALQQCALPSVVVLRPSREGDGQPASSLIARFASGWLSVLSSYLIPPSLQHVRSDIIARAAVHFLLQAEPGFRVASARDIHEWAHPDAGPRRGF